jgi:hypothetical protein
LLKIMARKVVNRKALREEVEAAEQAEETKQAVTKKKMATKRKSRSKDTLEVRRKLFWGVFNQSMKRVALFEFTQKKQAEKKAADLSASGKSPHFVQKVKEDVDQ